MDEALNNIDELYALMEQPEISDDFNIDEEFNFEDEFDLGDDLEDFDPT
jgi:hypothetical protein